MKTLAILAGWYLFVGLCWTCFWLHRHKVKEKSDPCQRCCKTPLWAQVFGVLLVSPFWPMSVARYVMNGFKMKPRGRA